MKASRITPTWFHAVEVSFLDAPSADEAKAIVEARSIPPERIEVWAVTPSTPKMEADYLAWQATCAEWTRLASSGGNPRGLL